MGVQAQNQSENNSKCKQNMERTGSEPFVFGKDALWEDLGGGVKRQILGYDGQLMMVKVVFEKGAVGAPPSPLSKSMYVCGQRQV